jgi:hypothetical protein
MTTARQPKTLQSGTIEQTTASPEIYGSTFGDITVSDTQCVVPANLLAAAIEKGQELLGYAKENNIDLKTLNFDFGATITANHVAVGLLALFFNPNSSPFASGSKFNLTGTLGLVDGNLQGFLTTPLTSEQKALAMMIYCANFNNPTATIKPKKSPNPKVNYYHAPISRLIKC